MLAAGLAKPLVNLYVCLSSLGNVFLVGGHVWQVMTSVTINAIFFMLLLLLLLLVVVYAT